MNSPASTAQTWAPPRRHLGITILMVLATVGAVLAIAFYWGESTLQGEEVTENAYVRGRTTVIAPQVSGYLVEVLGHDFQRVQTGEVLARIDDRVYRSKVAQARASLQAAQHNLANNAQAHFSSEAAWRSTDAAVLGAEAQLQRAKADMARAARLVDDGSGGCAGGDGVG